ncbi:Receptor-interacting serine/threonine-protein kinase 2 [Acipenser ruthenus]|uniref:Receptor-interacting serine/threonine-protein kinase 2 n=1 Tax=Acipenser ruthenus TaxID=7906 RepID=A0A662YT70_ACIRT|nr:Receptor-interacting serine/threonine-protein kinase 2 [Acipenser ruthenus]
MYYSTDIVSTVTQTVHSDQDKNSVILNGDVVGVTVENEVIADLVEPVIFTFFHKKQPQISNKPVHNLEAQTNITYIGCGISALCCVLTIGLFLCQRKCTSDKSSLIHMNLAVALLLLNVSFLLNMTLASLCNERVCTLLALMLHYSLLCSFTWMGIEAYNVYRLLCQVFRTYTSLYMLKLCLVGFVLPAAFVCGFASRGAYGLYRITSSTGTETTMSCQCRMAQPCNVLSIPSLDVENLTLIRASSGACLRGQLRGHGRQVSIKVLTVRPTTESDWTERLKEIALVCRVVSDCMGGGSLLSLLYECQLFPELPLPLLLRILLDVAEGVCHLHSLTPPLLHEALKSSNVLLDTQNRAKVCDYGLSQWRAWTLQSVPADYSGLCSGDLAYLSPETLRGEAPSAKGDVYSFAMLMWETLSRRRPYQDIGQPQDLVSSVQSGARPDTGEEFIPVAVPQRNSLIQLMTQCWHPDPHTRPQIRDCVLELRRVVETFHPDTLSQAALLLKEMKERAVEGCKDQLIHTLQIEINNLEISSRNPKNAGNKSVPMETVQMLKSAPVGPDPRRTSPKTPPVPQMGRGVPMEAASQRESCSFASSLPSKPACLRGDGGEQQSSPDRCCPGQSPPPPPLHQTDSFSQPDQCTLAWFPERSCCRILQDRRGSIVRGMTEGRLNYVLDRLRSRQALAREDYEYITAALTLAARTRCLLDTCLCLGEGTAQLVVQALGLGSSRGLCQ